MAYTKLIPRRTRSARVEEISREAAHYLLSLPRGHAGEYRLAQLDDYAKLARGGFPLKAPVTVSLAAKTSSKFIPGTWGFGFWNDPFGLSLGFGGNPFRLPALPNAVWFFGASKESYLSFRDPRVGQNEVPTKSQVPNGNSCKDRASTTPPPYGGSAQRGIAANGFIAQTFRSPLFHPLLIPAGLALPFSRRLTRRLFGTVIGEDGSRLDVDATQWHRYRIDWRAEQVLFMVDDVVIFESSVSPHSPLGLVIWIDNQYAAFTPEGKIGFGVLENPEPAWLEVKNIEVLTSGANSERSDRP